MLQNRLCAAPARAPGIFLATLATVCLAAATADAGPKTDRVLLKNGDRVTCEIKQLDRGLLQVSTDDMGTINIEWNKVAALTSPSTFEVRTSAGMFHYGHFAPADEGSITVVDEAETATVALLDVIGIEPLKQKFFDRLDGSLDAGGSYTQASGVGQATFSLLVLARRPAFEWQITADATVTAQENQPDTGRVNGQFAYARLLRNRWVVPGFARFERNQDLGFQARTTLGLGVGRYLLQSNRSLLMVSGGISANQEVPTEGPAIANVEATFSLSYSFFTYDFPKTDLSVSLASYPSLNDLGRVRVSTDVKIKRDVFTSDYFLALTVYDDYDSRPPTADAKTNDVGVTFSIGWKF